MGGHAIMHRASHHVVYFYLRMPMRAQHDPRMGVEEVQPGRHALDAAGARLVDRSLDYLTFRQLHVPFARDRFSPGDNLSMFAEEPQSEKESFDVLQMLALTDHRTIRVAACFVASPKLTFPQAVAALPTFPSA